MKKIHLLTALLIGQFFSVQVLFATDIPENPKSHFYSAKQELVNMLEGKNPLSYEQAITTIENAYWENKVDISFFNYSIDQHLKNIQRIIEVNRDYSNQDFKRTLLETEEQKKAKYERALANWAIFSYMTDTTFFVGQEKLFYNLPFSYSTNDPLGTINWSNTQVFNLLDTKKGNCFALVSLYKIFSERLNSQAIICTAPGHIYIRHADHKGIYHNVELATGAFSGTGSMETLTYTTDEATRNGISLRELELKQSVALCLVYLAKGYEYKFNTRSDDFLLECAELALKYDSLNLNAMLLKAEVLEERLIAKNKTVAQLQKEKDFIEYENFINNIFSLGYREMPMEMKNLVISRLRNEDTPYPVKDHTPKPNEHLGVKNDRYFTLSGGLFDEMMLTKPVEQYHRTHFDTKKKKISAFVPLDTTYNKYPIDLVVFAWSIDPLYAKFPSLSPYVAFANNPVLFIDPDGKEIAIKDPNTGKTCIFKPGDPVPDGSSQFVNNVYASLNHLYNNGGESAVNLINDLVADHSYKVTIKETTAFGSGKTSYDAKQNIAFNPHEGLIVGGENDGNNKQSPSLGLIHELDHANQHRTLLGNLNDAKAGKDKNAIKDAKNALNEFWTGDAEEERVVSGVERNVAKSLKEGFRNNYDDVKGIFKSDSPTSTGAGIASPKEQKQIDKTNKSLK
jgi:hypothetical protein